MARRKFSGGRSEGSSAGTVYAWGFFGSLVYGVATGLFWPFVLVAASPFVVAAGRHFFQSVPTSA